MNPVTLKIKKCPGLPADHLFSLPCGKHLLGRSDKESTIVLPDQGISRKHCELSVGEDGSVFAEDLNSGNGTYLNGQKIKGRTPLKTGDSLRLCETTLEVTVPRAEVKPQAAATPGKAAPGKASSTRTASRGDAYRWIKWAGLSVACLLILAFMFVLFGKVSKHSIPSPENCTEVYVLPDMGCRFNYPPEWKRIDKYKKQVLGLTWFNRSVLFFGTQYEGKDVMFCVDLLEGVPPGLPADRLIRTSSTEFPRALPHTGKGDREFETLGKAMIGTKEGTLGMSPVFDNQGVPMKSLEAFVKDADRRYLILGFAPADIFEAFVPVFKQMILSFQIDPRTGLPPRPEGVRSESNLLVQRADGLAEKSHLQADNLFRALKDYWKALQLINLYDFRENDTDRVLLQEKYLKAQKAFDERFEELKFEVERGIKVGEEEAVFNAASAIVKMIPDPEDKRFQYADKFYSKLKSRYEGKSGALKLGSY